MTSVRTGFADKILRLVSFYCNIVEGRKASKYAAILALSVEDPVEVNRKMAYRHLQVIFSQPILEWSSRGGGGIVLPSWPPGKNPWELICKMAYHAPLPTF